VWFRADKAYRKIIRDPKAPRWAKKNIIGAFKQRFLMAFKTSL